MYRIFFGHHKCATTWISSLAKELCRRLGLTYDSSWDYPEIDPIPYMKSKSVDFLSLTNASAKNISKDPDFRSFHVIRDPRDLIVSAYYSHLFSHNVNNDWVLPLREKLSSLSKKEGLLLEISHSQRFISAIQQWNFDNPNILEIKMEDMILDPLRVMGSSFSFLGLLGDGGIPFDQFKELLERRSFEKITGRVQGAENRHHHYRKGVAGDWKNHFTDMHCRRFKEIYGDILIKLGYESNNHWDSNS